MRCKIHRALVINPSQPSFWIPGNPDKNLSVTSFPRPVFLNRWPSMTRVSCLRILWPGGLLPSDQTNSNVATTASWILLKLWSIRWTSNQLPCGSTILHHSKLSSAVPHNTAFLPPAFMAILPPIQLASAEVGSTAKTRPDFSAASETLLVTTPASEKIVATSCATPGIFLTSTGDKVSNFSVLITAEKGVNGIAPPV